MTRRFLVRPEAEAELRDAYAWYEEQRPGLGDDFLLCIDACLAGIARSPELHPVVHRTIRRALLRRFPYGIFYVFDHDVIAIIAVFHLSRDPRRWMERGQ